MEKFLIAAVEVSFGLLVYDFGNHFSHGFIILSTSFESSLAEDGAHLVN